MPDDDDADCDHDWAVMQVLADQHGARLVHECRVCEAVWYEPSRSD